MPILDHFSDFDTTPNSPIAGGFDVTPSDSTDLPQVTRGIMVSAAGDVFVTLKSGDQLILPGLTPGVIYPVRVARVWAAGTSATGIKGLV
ncbi:MAG: hypothetical protein AAGL89_02525, partial [Pseudomonadota bacterium]